MDTGIREPANSSDFEAGFRVAGLGGQEVEFPIASAGVFILDYEVGRGAAG